MRKIITGIFICISLASFIACKNKKDVANENIISLTMSEANPSGSISAWVDQAFIDKVSELSNGKIKITLCTDSILGDNASVMKVMTKPHSEIHLARISPASLVTHGCEKHELLDIPFTFVNREHFWNFASSPVAHTILDEPYEKEIGVKGLFFAEEGFRHFFSTQKLNGLADFKGIKIRTAGNSTMAKIAESLQGIPVAVSFSDLYSSLQTGIVDIAEQPIANYLSNHFNKIAPYMILDGHQLGVTEVVITADAWNSLTKEQQAIMYEASKYAGNYCRKISEEAENTAKLSLQSEGTTFTEVKDISAWQTACADVIRVASQKNSDLYAEIVKLAK